MNQSLVGLLIIQDNSIKYANKKCSDITGYNIDEILTFRIKDIRKLIHPEDRNFVIDQLEKKLSGNKSGVDHYNFRIIKKSGKVVWIENFSQAIELKGRPADLIIANDISDEIEARIALRRSETKYRLITENANDIITIINENFEYEYLNEANKRVMGYNIEDLIGESVLKNIHPEDKDKALRLLITGFIEGEGKADIRVKDINGVYRWLEVKGKTFQDNEKTKAILISRDITERKRMENMLIDNARKMAFLNHIILDANKAKDLNKVLEKILSYTLDLMKFESGGIYLLEESKQFASLMFHENLPIEFIEEVKNLKITERHYKTIYLEGVPIFTDDYAKYDNKISNKYGFKATAIIPVFDREKIIGSINITAKKKYDFSSTEREILWYIGQNVGILIAKMKGEEEIKKQNVELKELDKLKDEFFADISHEFRTPLTIIKGFAEILLTHSDNLKNDQIEDLKMILKNEKRLEKLVNEILNYSRLKAGKVKFNKDDFKVSEIVDDIKMEIKPFLEEKELEIIDSYEPDAQIILDKTQIFSVIKNLITNAIKFSYNNNKIYIDSRIEDGIWTFKITDEGIGMIDIEISKLFRRFMKIQKIKDNVVDGIGIGLAMCKKIIENYNGKIWAESDGRDTGSTFYFSIDLNDVK
ncbi:MAG: PAS domain S-box protein [Candidatus Lokiarchaeota archaeon]|nr:PAS domain S-box protein [Candidatus Lokiarchaeota archaeon]